MTVRQIIEEGLKVHRLTNGDDAGDPVGAVLEEVGLEPAMQDRYPHEFSGGQRQRIAIARVLCHEVIVLRDGVVVESGPTEAIFEEPKTAYTQALLAAALDLKATETGAVRM